MLTVIAGVIVAWILISVLGDSEAGCGCLLLIVALIVLAKLLG